jgi:hypothetical protein
MIVHGWGESISTPWVNEMVHNFLSLRGNCVFFMDYSNFSSRGYFDLTPRFDGISAVLRKKISTFKSPEKIQMFGFSFGARLVVDAAMDVSKNGKKIGRIYACDPAGPGFFYYKKDPKRAANFVQCINTSNDKGTSNYNCHQNWRFEWLFLIFSIIVNPIYSQTWQLRPFTNRRERSTIRFTRSLSLHFQCLIQAQLHSEEFKSMQLATNGETPSQQSKTRPARR